MKNLSLLLILFGLWSANAQTPEEMKAWQDAMTPGAQHKWMASSVGDWDVEMKMWMDPSQPPVVSTGTNTNSMAMDGRFLEYNFKGTVMGMPFTGKGVMGYDNTAQKYYSTWYDNMSTSLMYMEGTFDEKTKTMTSMGESIDPMTKKVCQIKEITKFISNDKYVMEMYSTMDGKEMKMMELTYTRKK
jgi:hypothetical protein